MKPQPMRPTGTIPTRDRPTTVPPLSRGSWFRISTLEPAIMTAAFRGFPPNSLKQILGEHLKTGHERFLPYRSNSLFGIILSFHAV
jgi:hypothetical protein